MPGWKELVICGKSPITQGLKFDPTDLEGSVHASCDFNALMVLVNHLISDMILISTFIVVAVLVFAGIKLLTSGGNEGALKEVKGMFTKVIIGYLWILGAWVLIYTITNALIGSQYLELLGKPKSL